VTYDVLLVDLGLAAAFIGFLLIVRPLRSLGIASRGRAAVLLGSGVALTVLGATLPCRLQHPTGRHTRLDDFLPAYHFHEVHSLAVHAPPDRVFRAIHDITAREIRFFRTLTWIRSPHFGKTRKSILAPPPAEPILDVALHSGFLLLAEEADRELVVGTVLGPPLKVGDPGRRDFLEFDRPGYAKAAMNFLVEEQQNGWCRLSTETRIFATDPTARRRFAAYWRVIYPGSALIRRMWLEAIKRRAQGG
jgi:hypothetical protein